MTEAEIATIVAEHRWRVDTSFFDATNVGGDVVERYLPEVRREDAYEVVQYLRDQSRRIITNPMTGLKWALSGTWIVSEIWWVWTDEEKHEKFHVYERLTREGAGDGLSILVEDSCRWEVTRTFYWDVAVVPDLPPNSEGVMYAMGAVIRDDKTKLFSTYIEKRVRLPQLTGQYVARIDAGQTDIESKYLGVTSEKRAELGIDAPLYKETGRIKYRDIVPNEDCTQDITERATLVNNQTVKEWEVSAARLVERTKQTSSDDPSPTEPPSATEGVIIRHSKEPTPEGRVRVAVEKETRIPQESIEYEENAARKILRTRHIESDTIPIPEVPPEAGTQRSISQSPTETGKVNSVDETVMVKKQIGAEKEVSAARTVTRDLGYQNDWLDLENDFNPANGMIKRRVNRPTPEGKYETINEIEKRKNQTSVSLEKSAASDVRRTLNTETDELSDISRPEIGKVRLVQEPTETGKVRRIEEVETPKSQTIETFIVSKSRKIKRKIRTHEESLFTEPLAVVGKIITRQTRPTEFGSNELTEEEDIPENQAGEEYERSRARSVTRYIETERDTKLAMPGTPTDYSIKRGTSRPTETGRYHTVQEEEQRIDQQVTSTGAAGDETWEEEFHTETAELPKVSAPTEGQIEERISNPNETGRCTTRRRIRKARRQEFNTTFPTKNGEAQIKVVRNDTKTAANNTIENLSSNLDHSPSVSINPFDLIDYSIISRPRANGDDGAAWPAYCVQMKRKIDGAWVDAVKVVGYGATVASAEDHADKAGGEGMTTIDGDIEVVIPGVLWHCWKLKVMM